jgi:26S proteasome regulatory subunit T6
MRPVRLLREELQLLMEPGSYVGEVVKAMGKTKVLVKVQPEGKYSTCSVISVRLYNTIPALFHSGISITGQS